MTAMRALYVLLTLTCFHISGECSNILAIMPANSRSHFIVMEPLLKALALRGHQLTVISPFPQTVLLENYTDIDVSKSIPKGNSLALDQIREINHSLIKCLKLIGDDIGYNTCRNIYKDERIQKILNSSRKFDLIITEIFSTDCFALFAHIFDAPLISIVTSVSLPWANDRIGNPDNPSHIVNYFNHYDSHMTFYERASNVAHHVLTKLGYYHYAESLHSHVIREFYGDQLPDIGEIYNKRTALIFVNSHFTINQPRPMVPNFIEIGGIHLQDPSPLPKDLQKLLDEAENGFIYFSMGTIVDVETWPNHMIISFLDAFASYDGLVLWKYNGKLPYLPTNVITQNWLPQKDILVHKNLKLFITHGGLSSTLEAVNAGVPILGIPMFADQKGNVMSLVRKGNGIFVDYDSITKDEISKSIKQIVEEKSYKENALRLSKLFKDRPQSPLDSAVFWTEHVLRHKGAPHLRSAAADLPLYKLLLLDIALVFVLALLVIFTILYKVACLLIRIVRKTVSKKTNFPKNKKIQ